MKKYEFTLDHVHNEDWTAFIVVSAHFAGLPPEVKQSISWYDMPDWRWCAYLTITENHPLFDKDVDFWHDYCHCGCTFFETTEKGSFNTWGSSFEDRDFDTFTKYRVIGMDFSHYRDNFDVDPKDGIPWYIEKCAMELFNATNPNPVNCEGYENNSD